jgi:hypothetical protein
MSHATRLLTNATLLALLLSALGCKESDKTEPSSAGANAPTPATSGAPNAGDRAALNEVLASYEQVRIALADDRLADATSPATALKGAAEKAAANAPAALTGHLRGIATAAGALSSPSAGDGAALRKAFGEVSRHVVALIEADPTLAEGRHLFECPMANGYKKWVQTTPNISNPYMGKEMLTCGAAASSRRP